MLWLRRDQSDSRSFETDLAHLVLRSNGRDKSYRSTRPPYDMSGF